MIVSTSYPIKPPIINCTATNKITAKPIYPTHLWSWIYFAKYEAKAPTKITEEISVADAHPNGKKPFKRKDYINKFKTLTNEIIETSESERFLNDAQNLKNLAKSELHKLNIEVKSNLQKSILSSKGIF